MRLDECRVGMRVMVRDPRPVMFDGRVGIITTVYANGPVRVCIDTTAKCDSRFSFRASELVPTITQEIIDAHLLEA